MNRSGGKKGSWLSISYSYRVNCSGGGYSYFCVSFYRNCEYRILEDLCLNGVNLIVRGNWF